MKARVNWFEVSGDDVDGLVRFYRDLFEWEPADPDGVGYFQQAPVPGGERDGNPGGIWDGGPAGGPYATFYAEVDDVDATLDQAEQLGGKVLLTATDLGQIRIGHLQDPSGNRVGVYHRNAA
jgi:predicted enzyme related to lactoylglutathione lyase